MRYRMNKTVLSYFVFGLVLSVCIPTANAADAGSYALLIQQSPADAGSVTPGAGVHEIQIGQTVSLSAIPKPGYRFLYWLGDVSATGTPDTTIDIDSPKMVVAVFSREAFEEELPGVSLIKGAGVAGGGAGGRLIGTPLRNPAAANPGAYTYFNPSDTIINDYGDGDVTTTEEGDPWFPEGEDATTEEGDPWFPEDGNSEEVTGENGEEVPEPATVLMLGLGAIAVFKRNRR